jgi:hypothetical protein
MFRSRAQLASDHHLGHLPDFVKGRHHVGIGIVVVHDLCAPGRVILRKLFPGGWHRIGGVDLAECGRIKGGCSGHGRDDEAGGVRTILFWLGVAFHEFPFGESGLGDRTDEPCGPKLARWGLLTGEGCKASGGGGRMQRD